MSEIDGADETKTCAPRCKATNSAGDRCYLDRGHLDPDHVFSFPPPREITDEALATDLAFRHWVEDEIEAARQLLRQDPIATRSALERVLARLRREP